MVVQSNRVIAMDSLDFCILIECVQVYIRTIIDDRHVVNAVIDVNRRVVTTSIEVTYYVFITLLLFID